MDSSLSISYESYDPYEADGLLTSENILVKGQMDSAVVCEMTGSLVYRVNAVRSGFEKTMNHICTETSILLTNRVFDEQAKLRETWITGARSGSRIWDSRLDEGDFLVIENVEVIKAHRRMGLGTSMVSQLLHQLKTRNIQWIFTHWGYAYGKDIEIVEEKEAVIAFWKALGFRRIGLSHLFCYAMEDDDISKKLAIDDDNFSSENSYSTEYDSARVSSVQIQESTSEFKCEKSPQLDSHQFSPMDIDSTSDLDGREARKDSKVNLEVGNISEDLKSPQEANQDVVGVFSWDW